VGRCVPTDQKVIGTYNKLKQQETAMSNPLDEKTQRRVMAEIDLGQTPHGDLMYGSRAWRINYKKLCKLRDDDTLRYIAEDCRQAVEAQPDGLKCWQYSNEQRYCEHELYRRDRDRERGVIEEVALRQIVEDVYEINEGHKVSLDDLTGRRRRIEKLLACVPTQNIKEYLGRADGHEEVA
tara:strand:- start:25 stop:564 length:540 start_codon:yes stop_codon:yes gene_type:complete